MSERTNVGKRTRRLILERLGNLQSDLSLTLYHVEALRGSAPVPDAGTVTYEPTGDPDIWLKRVTTEVPAIERALSPENQAFKDLIDQARASRERCERASAQAKRRQAAMQIESYD